jgi:hypothetical protein
MPYRTRSTELLKLLALTTLCLGCEEPAAKKAEPATPPAPAAAPATATPEAAPSAEPPPKLRDDCPDGSSGVGTLAKPCLASGQARMMEVKYTGRTTDEGPKFSVTNKSKNPVLFGSLAVYFYDKSGKQLQVTGGARPRALQSCSGNVFAGAVKPGEKIFVFFSCVKKSHVPEGTATIEAEVKTVGFADEGGGRNEFYWSNPDLAPEERPKGGVKTKGEAKK